MYFKSPLDTAKKWHTILFVPYGRGGAGMSVLDVTNPNKPLHLWSIFNDKINNRVYRVDHNQVIYNYDYISNSYSLKPESLVMKELKWKYLIRSAVRGRNIMMTGPAGCG